MLILGLTGSIGMGKSTAAALFRQEGVPVHDADDAVHRLYRGAAVPVIEAAFPGTVANGVVDRRLLGERVLADPTAIAHLERLVHPLVESDRRSFLASVRAAGGRLAVFDVPLLFETGGERLCDLVIVVSAPADVQKARVLAREGMTEARFASILQKQMPDAEKRRRAHLVIQSGLGLESAQRQIKGILRSVSGLSGHAEDRILTAPTGSP